MPFDTPTVDQKAREVLKAASNPSTDPAVLLGLLTELRGGVVATDVLLRNTKVGIYVNRLKQHANAQVKAAASELVTKWKNDVNRGAGTPKSASGTPKPAAAASSAAKEASPKVKAGRPDVPKDKRNSKTDGVNIKVTGSDTRDNCVKLMYDGLAFMSEEAPDQILPIAKAIEQAVLDAHSPEGSEPYKTKIRSLYQNLRSKTNATLRTKMLSGDIAPSALVGMTHEEMKSEERKAEDAKMMKENMDNAMVPQEEQSISTSLRCGKCGQKKVTYTQAQTRSADEPMTTFCTCLNCGNRWKFS